MPVESAAETTAIPVSGALARLGAVAYLAVLAYPARREWKKRDEFVNAWKALFVKGAIKRGFPRLEIRAEYRSRPNQQINNAIGKGIRRIVRWRLPAAAVLAEGLIWSTPSIGRMLMTPFLAELQRSNPKIDFRKLKIKITKPSARLVPTIRRVVGRRQSKLDVDDSTKRFLRRHWRSTLPVLPLAVALHGVRLEAPESKPFDLVQNPRWLPKALRQADILARYLSSRPDFRGVKFVRLIPSK